MSACGSGTREQDYDLGLHVGALFIILGVSAGACALPIVAIRVPQLRVPAKAHFAFRHFGTGVLIATVSMLLLRSGSKLTPLQAFVHLFPTAFISLIDPCLSPFFNEAYPALPGAIALAAVFIIAIAEMIFSPGRSLCSGPPTDGAATVDVTRSFSVPHPRPILPDAEDDTITPGEDCPQIYRSKLTKY